MIQIHEACVANTSRLAGVLKSGSCKQRVLLRSFSSYAPLSSPPLFDMCVQKSFDRALERARTHPHEAKFKHPRNWTALHCCVEQVAPLDLVKAVYEANPDALTTKDWQGLTPVEAAVDLETKEYLTSALKNLQEKKETDPVGSGNTNVKDPMLIGKIISHVNSISNEAKELRKTTEKLEKELKELQNTLRVLSK